MPNMEITEVGRDKKISLLDIWKTEVAYRQSLRRRKKAHAAYNRAKTSFDEADAEIMSANTGYTAKKRFLDKKEEEFSKIENEYLTTRERRDTLRERMNEAYDAHKKGKKELEDIDSAIENHEQRVEDNRKGEVETRNTIKRTKVNIETLTQRDKELNAAKVELAANYQALKDQAAVSVDEQEAELEEINAQLAVMDKKISKVTDVSDQLKAELLLLENEENEVAKTVARMESDIKNTEKGIEVNKENIKRLDERCVQSAEESEELNKQADGLSEEYSMLSVKLDQQRADAKKERESYFFRDKLDEMEKTVKEAAQKAVETHKLEDIDDYATILAQYDFYQRVTKPDVTVTFSPWKMSSMDGDASLYMTVKSEAPGEEPEVLYLSFKAIGENGKPVVRGRWEYLSPVVNLIFYRRTPEGFAGEIPTFRSEGEEYYNSEDFNFNSKTDYFAKIRSRQNAINTTIKEIEKQKTERAEIMEKADALRKEAAAKLAESERCKKDSIEQNKELVDREEKLKNLTVDILEPKRELEVKKVNTEKKRAELEVNEKKVAEMRKEEEPFIAKKNEVTEIINKKYGDKKEIRDEMDAAQRRLEETVTKIKDTVDKKLEMENKLVELEEKLEWHKKRYAEIDDEDKEMISRKAILDSEVKDWFSRIGTIDRELSNVGEKFKKLEHDYEIIRSERDVLAEETRVRKEKADEASKVRDEAKSALDEAQQEFEESMTQVDFTLALQKTYIKRFLTGA